MYQLFLLQIGSNVIASIADIAASFGRDQAFLNSCQGPENVL
jgi:hypothetical protein